MLLRQVLSVPVKLGFSHSICLINKIQIIFQNILPSNRWEVGDNSGMGSESVGHKNGVLNVWKKSYLFFSAYLDGLR